MNAETIKRIVRAIADGSQEDLDRLARRVVESERRTGHTKLADELEAILRQPRRRKNGHRSATDSERGLKELPLSRRHGELLATVIAREALEHHMVLPAGTEDRFGRDVLCNDYDVLIIQSAGNLKFTRPAPRPGIAEQVAAGSNYPEYLADGTCRVANPAQSFQALTVGSIAYGAFEQEEWRSFASEDGHPSAFTRVGLGIWGSIKPEVVEYGGDCLRNRENPPTVDTPQVGRDCYPELVRSTMYGGPAYDRDEVGTSYAAPKVARIASRLQNVLPDESCLLYRGLIVQSAQWPAWAENLSPEEQAKVLRRIGYGVTVHLKTGQSRASVKPARVMIAWSSG